MTNPRIAAIVPVAPLEAAKSRLGGALDAEERLDLAERLLARTVTTALDVPGLADVLVVSPDRDVLERAAGLGARTLRQRTRGLNAGLREARDDVVAGGVEALLVLPIDLPFVTAATINAVLEPIGENHRRPVVALVPDRHGSGTNVLVLQPPTAIEFCFGPESRRAHREAAMAAGATYVELDGPLTVDLDTPADLVLVDSMTTEGIRAG
jgi:2-phospho-L-lactate/phosphoenolpyruvate guanylyltransferase